MALKDGIKAGNGQLHDDFHECRAVSRLRPRRVNNGEWAERRERRERRERKERRLGKVSFKRHASKVQGF